MEPAKQRVTAGTPCCAVGVARHSVHMRCRFGRCTPHVNRPEKYAALRVTGELHQAVFVVTDQQRLTEQDSADEKAPRTC